MLKDEFVDLLKKYPDCLADERRFTAYMRDYFPKSQKECNILIDLYHLGIVEDLKLVPQIDQNFFYRYKKKIIDSYGIIDDLAEESVKLWCICYGKMILEKEYNVIENAADIEKKNYNSDASENHIKKLIGMRVTNLNTHATGTIESIKNGCVEVDFHGSLVKFAFPSSFAGILELEDESFQQKIQIEGIEDSFENFKRDFRFAINNEVDYLKSTGGRKYRIIDGERIPSQNGEFVYAFDTDTDLHFPDGTAIKLWFPDNIVNAYVISCEDFTILIRTMEYIGESVESVEFTSEQWHLLESLMDRLDEMNPSNESLSYEIACNGRKKITQWQSIKKGQNQAFNQSISEKITFIWGPPGTGKTETLANVAVEHIKNGKRVLMLSYSNVSVDGALLRVANKLDFSAGSVIRYGYPRMKELLESETLSSYQFVLHKNAEKTAEYQALNEKKKRLKKKSKERLEINKKLNNIREYLLEEEQKVIHQAVFVATTVSKAVVDKAIYMQRFDVVIFDEASMAYVPQIVFSAGLAKKHFICLGDFRQLPAIVQNSEEGRMTRDIFEYTGITSAVENNCGHEWLVMLNLQYRMHQSIADFVSKEMYWGLLKTSDRIIAGRKEIAESSPCQGAAMSLVDLSGMFSVCTKTNDKSRINVLSAFICLRLAEKNINQYEVGIITPYSAQSRLILAMIRDIQEYDKRWMKVSCATVHQFQGSEKPIIIYDAVDCYRMPYPGQLLTSKKNDTANRLFNVALTRAKGKFILVANTDFLKRKHISQKLIFTKAMNWIKKEKCMIKGNYVLDELMPEETERNLVYIQNRQDSWSVFIHDLAEAKDKIHIDIPDVIDDNDDAIEELLCILKEKKNAGVDICIRHPEDVDLPQGLQVYEHFFEYVTNPIALIDKEIIWFGQPLYAADFISEGEILDTEYFPCVRFKGMHTARLIKAFLEI